MFSNNRKHLELTIIFLNLVIAVVKMDLATLKEVKYKSFWVFFWENNFFVED